MFCYQQRPFYSCEVISGHLVSMMSLKMYRPLPSCSRMKILCTYIFSLSQRQETTPKVLVFLSRWSWVTFRSCEALVLRLVEASPPGACPYPIVSDANKHRPSQPPVLPQVLELQAYFSFAPVRLVWPRGPKGWIALLSQPRT